MKINYKWQEDEMDNLFQIEVAKRETIFSCNVCDEEFENSDNFRMHISYTYRML